MKLEDNSIVNIAKQESIDPAALLAVKVVESGNTSGFLPDGQPVILFEGHIFYKYYNQRHPQANKAFLMAQHPTIYYKSWTKAYYKGGSAEHLRLQEAIGLDREAALMSASWGIGQIMGFNYRCCNCENIQDFINKQYKSIDSQIRTWILFLRNQGYINLLNNYDWNTFARKYNGPGQVNIYANKLQKEYNKFKSQIR